MQRPGKIVLFFGIGKNKDWILLLCIFVLVSPYIKYRNPVYSIQLFLNLTQLFSIESTIVYCKSNKSERNYCTKGYRYPLQNFQDDSHSVYD